MKFGPGCKKVHESGKENVDRVNFIKAFCRKHNKSKKHVEWLNAYLAWRGEME